MERRPEVAHQPESNVVDTVVQLLCESGITQMAEAVRIMLNEAMRIERSRAIEAEPYQRTERRKGYANGFKPKTLDTRLGAITFQVPQTRGVEFYPAARNDVIAQDDVQLYAALRRSGQPAL